MQIEDALRRSGVGSVPAPAAPAASGPSQAQFFNAPKPDAAAKAARQKGLIEALRKRGN
jgi:hypothetical protein